MDYIIYYTPVPMWQCENAYRYAKLNKWKVGSIICTTVTEKRKQSQTVRQISSWNARIIKRDDIGLTGNEHPIDFLEAPESFVGVGELELGEVVATSGEAAIVDDDTELMEVEVDDAGADEDDSEAVVEDAGADEDDSEVVVEDAGLEDCSIAIDELRVEEGRVNVLDGSSTEDASLEVVGVSVLEIVEGASVERTEDEEVVGRRATVVVVLGASVLACAGAGWFWTTGRAVVAGMEVGSVALDAEVGAEAAHWTSTARAPVTPWQIVSNAVPAPGSFWDARLVKLEEWIGLVICPLAATMPL